MAGATRICCHLGAFCVHDTTMHRVTSGGRRAALGTTQRGAGDGHAQPQQRSPHFRPAAGATGGGCPEDVWHHGDGHALPVLCFLLPGSRAGGGRGRVPETARGKAKGAGSHDDPRGVT